MLLLTPQSYGARIQNYMAKVFNWKPVNQNKDRGDWENAMGQHFEVKCSLITNTNDTLNLVQLRLWQDLDGYYCFAIDTRTSPFSTYAFFLASEQMEAECNLIGASSAHGTSSAVASNANKELRMGLKIQQTDPHFIRWQDKYLIKGVDAKLKEPRNRT